MKAKIAAKFVGAGLLIGMLGWWLRGHEILTAWVLSLLFLAVIAKLAGAIIARRRGGFTAGGIGPETAGRAVPRVPLGGPPTLTAAAAEKWKPDP
jgi:hypothetical protein